MPSRMLRLGIMVVVALGLSACQTTAHRQVDALKRTKDRPSIVLMPLDVELSELSAAGVPEPKADWTDAAKRHLHAAIAEVKNKGGIRLAEFDEGKARPELLDRLDQIQRLHAAVGQTVLVHHYIPALQLPSKQGRFDWSMGPPVTALKEATGADYALFVHVRDSYSSAGRVALIAVGALFGVGIPGGAQVGFASLVDLDTGDIVYFNRLARGYGDLRTEAAARETSLVLMEGMPR